ncbi:hypothetical protein WJX81_006037 [Elliptochloris bilobata]|uniref:Protein SirB1 N-terminal domain-containing protein n=1 Tax=Elliptochloris bilobata TaxID=381761 RepID=A0AAW1QK44_9CHLO
MAKACLLIALEEEAAELESAQLDTSSERWLELFDTAHGPEASFALSNSELGTKSTWSLERLDALAAEARAEFVRTVDPLPPPPPLLKPRPLRGGTTRSATADQQPGKRSRRSGARADAAPAAASAAGVAAVSGVLHRHGYRRMGEHGDPRDSRLSQVLERGSGCPAALAVLHMELCRRLGLPLAAAILDEGRYVVLWPEATPLAACGQRVVIDPYCGGDLLLLSEVCEVFQHERDALMALRPASRCEILAALLAQLRDAHWARAVGCRAEPGWLLPLAVGTALEGRVGPLAGTDIRRAIAAAERRTALLPACAEARLELALLLYFAGDARGAQDALPTHVVDVTYDDGFEGEFCMPGEVAVDNDSSKRFTILTVEVKDYPGLLRVIAWVVNGLDVLVENARLVTDNEGYAKNRFWLTDRRGRKLSNQNADLLAERVGDFVVYCTPDRKTMQAKQYASNGVHINNEAHSEYSVVTIAENRERASALLEVASAMTGIGIVIHEAVIQGSKVGKVPKLAEAPEVDVPEHGAAFKFWVTDRQNAKLDYARATALLYTLGLVFGRSNGPLQPPNASKFVLA